jgi:hypothetical protein
MPPSIPGLGQQGGFSFWLQDRSGGSIEYLDAELQRFLSAARARPELAGVSTDVLGQRAADVRRRRPGQGAQPGRGARRRLPDDADVSRRAVRQPVQPLRPSVARLPAGGRRGPHDAQPGSASSTFETMPAPWCPVRAPDHERESSGPMSRTGSTSYRAAQNHRARRPATARGQAIAALEDLARPHAAAAIQLRLVGPLLSGEAGLRRHRHDLRPVVDLRVPDSRGALRELVAALLGDADGARSRCSAPLSA